VLDRGAVAAYARAADLARADGNHGLAAIYLSMGVNTCMLGGGDTRDAAAAAETALTSARQSGMHATIITSLNSLALALVEFDPTGRGRFCRRASNAARRPPRRSPRGSSRQASQPLVSKIGPSPLRWPSGRCSSNAGSWLRYKSRPASPSVGALSPEIGPRSQEYCIAMNFDEAITYASANVDPRLLSGPVASIDR
jgi:hypothetical protein